MAVWSHLNMLPLFNIPNMRILSHLYYFITMVLIISAFNNPDIFSSQNAEQKRARPTWVSGNMHFEGHKGHS